MHLLNILELFEFSSFENDISNLILKIHNNLFYNSKIPIILYLPPGLYYTDPLYFNRSNLKIIGSGIDNTIIKLKPQKLFKDSHWSLIGIGKSREYNDKSPIKKLSNILISNLTLDGNKNNCFGASGNFHECLSFSGITNSAIINCKVINAVHNGIQLNNCRNILISNNIIDDVEGWGIHISCNGLGKHNMTKYCQIIRNSVSNSGWAKKRGGIDQNPSCCFNSYIDNSCYDNYQNYCIYNSVIDFKGNLSFNNRFGHITNKYK